MSSTRRRASSVVLLVAAVLVVTGAWLTLASNGIVPGSSTTTATSVTPGAPQEVAAPPAAPVTLAPPAQRRGAPRELRIPALGVDAAVLPVLAPGRTLVPPSDPAVLGWWADGARPGEARGSALVAGHTTRTGTGAFDDLETLRGGDRVVVGTGRGAATYVVRTVRTFDKGLISEEAGRLFDQRSRGRLVLLTCEDWDGARYRSNVVVTAVPAR